MYGKLIQNKKVWLVVMALGLVSLLFGSISAFYVPEEEHNMTMLMGMFTGFGGALLVLSIVAFIRMKFTSPAKLKKEEIELADERNIQLKRIAFTISSIVSTLLFCILTFLFMFLNYMVPALICLGALYVQIISFVIAYTIFSKKM